MAAVVTKTVGNKEDYPYLDAWAKKQLEAEERREKKLAEVREKIRKNRPEHMRCLDAQYAAQVEAKKPKYQYEVSCVLADKTSGKRIVTEPKETVSAKNENEAWAIFCDTIKAWPSPNACDRKIRKLD